MVYTPHEIVKPEAIVALGVGLLESKLIVPSLMARKSFDDYRGKRGDALNMVVPGVLPARDYGWRNDRSQEIQLDEYEERMISISVGGNAVSGTAVTDEQFEMDLEGDYAPLLNAQTRAVARRLEYGAVNTVKNADYAFTLAAREDELLKDIVEARRILNGVNVDLTNPYMLVGSDIDAIMQLDPNFTLASNVGDGRAENALANATLGRIKGFTVIQSNDIPADEFYAFDGTAFGFLNAAPKVPASAPFGATLAYNGISLRWVRAYDNRLQVDTSVVNAWYGFQAVEDPIIYWDEATQREVVTEEEYLVRGVKGKLGGTEKRLAGNATSDAGKLRKALGLEERANATKHSAAPTIP